MHLTGQLRWDERWHGPAGRTKMFLQQAWLDSGGQLVWLDVPINEPEADDTAAKRSQ